MKIKYVDPHDFLSGAAYEGDSGIDLRAASDPLIVGHNLQENDWKYIDYIEYDTNICIAPDSADMSCLLFPRSSISRYNLMLANSVGVIDPGYRDTIKVRFKYISQPADYQVFEKWLILKPSLDRIYKRGDKIAQIIFSPLLRPTWEKTLELPDSDRGKGGFGSSGS